MTDPIAERCRTAAHTSSNGGGEWGQLVHRCVEAADRIDELVGNVEMLKRVVHVLTCDAVPELALDDELVDDLKAMADIVDASRERAAVVMLNGRLFADAAAELEMWRDLHRH
jgi:hypothetical protein